MTRFSDAHVDTIVKLTEIDSEECGVISLDVTETVVYGFGNPAVENNNKVYRVGMALKFFSDYVCDYFKEDRIIATY